jgi:hypothetical protein
MMLTIRTGAGRRQYQSRGPLEADIERAFAQANLTERLRWPAAGVRTAIEV